MARTCTICAHVERDAIDHALVSRVSYRDIAKQHLVTISALSRHADRHLSKALTVVQAEREAEGAVTLLDRVEDLYSRAKSILEAADEDGKASVSLSAIRELRGIVELLGKLTGELDDRPQQVVNLLVAPEWLRVRAAIVNALDQYPEARLAVAERLAELDPPR